ncbi:transglycosylase SLT domain-containing protein [Myxococcaceae bacterium JPH2]|nr:transglycosylase SLT domain-containing protein [Myxococcaceae bacterium JPH2]
MDGFRSTTAVLLACANLLGPATAWAQAAPPDEPDEVLSDEHLEALLESPVTPLTGEPQEAATFGPEHLAPYLADGVLGRARAELERGRYERARRLLEQSEPTQPVRFFMAQSALLSGDAATAAREFSALAEDYVPLRDHCSIRAAQAFERLRKPTEAIARYRAVDAHSPLYPEARFRLAKLLQRQHDVPGALQALQEFIDSREERGPDPLRLKALLTLCDLARTQGLYNVEHRALLEVWATSPLSREGDRARQRLRGLPLPLKWRVRRAEALVELHHNQDAMDLLAHTGPLSPLPDELACRVRLLQGRALRKERQHRRAIQVLTPVVEHCLAPEQRPQALYLLAYSQSVVEPEAAIGTYATLAHDYPAHGYADDALFFEGWLLQRSGQEDDALTRYEDVARRYPTGNFAAEALFRAFWLHVRQGDTPAALASLASVEKLPVAARTDESLWRARYWQARMLESGDATNAAVSRYEHIATERPATWYGMLARARLALSSQEPMSRPLSPPVATPDGSRLTGELWPLPLGPLQHDPRFLAGVELLRLGQPGAVDELLAVDTRALSEESARLLYQTLRRTGRGWAARQVARVSLRQEVEGPLTPTSRPVWEATWPLAFRPLIERYARRSRVDPDLLQGLIREESRFNFRARSSTGALGLAQLMPDTAQAVARALGIPSVDEASLLQPAQNIRLGAAYLGQLLARFDGNPAYAVAAYNAGPAAVDRWRRDLPRAELDEWVEHISFEETREYVKHVLGSTHAYKLLYAPRTSPNTWLTRAPL